MTEDEVSSTARRDADGGYLIGKGELFFHVIRPRIIRAVDIYDEQTGSRDADVGPRIIMPPLPDKIFIQGGVMKAVFRERLLSVRYAWKYRVSQLCVVKCGIESFVRVLCRVLHPCSLYPGMPRFLPPTGGEDSSGVIHTL